MSPLGKIVMLFVVFTCTQVNAQKLREIQCLGKSTLIDEKMRGFDESERVIFLIDYEKQEVKITAASRYGKKEDVLNYELKDVGDYNGNEMIIGYLGSQKGRHILLISEVTVSLIFVMEGMSVELVHAIKSDQVLK